MPIAGPRYLRAVLDEYETHYNRNRPHGPRTRGHPTGQHRHPVGSRAAWGRIRPQMRKFLRAACDKAGLSFDGRPC